MIFIADYLINARLPDGVIYKLNSDVFNPVYLPYFNDNSRISIWFGGSSSGKSACKMMYIPLDIMFKERNFLFLCKEKKRATTSSANELKEAITRLGLDNYFEWRENPKVCTCKINKRCIWFEGCEDVEQIKSIKFPKGSVSDIVMEEATNFAENDFEQLILRQRGLDLDSKGNTIFKRIHLLFNPVSKMHWIYKRFFAGVWNEEKDKKLSIKKRFYVQDHIEVQNISILKTTYLDNKFLSPEDIVSIKSMTPEMYRVYGLGYFGSLGKKIFEQNVNYFIENDLRERINNIDGKICMGLDFGGGVAPWAFTKCKIDTKAKNIYVYDEFSIVDITVPELWRIIRPKVVGYGWVSTELNEDIFNQLRREGAPVEKTRKTEIVAGLNWLKSYKIYIDYRCTAIIDNFDNYNWKKDRMGNYIEVPEDRNNDSIDSLRYGLWRYIKGKNIKNRKSNISI